MQKHFGRAAAECFVSQLTLRAGVEKLEKELGAELFERT
ncbi:LysR family transcriptional regulator [Endozoicomonas lisbonensis]